MFFAALHEQKEAAVAVLPLQFFVVLRGPSRPFVDKKKLPLPFFVPFVDQKEVAVAVLRGPSWIKNTTTLNFDDSGFEKE